MSFLVKFKQFLSRNIILKKTIHYRKDLKATTLDNPNGLKKESKLGTDLNFKYCLTVPGDLLQKLGIERHHKIDADASCFIASYNNEPVGCILFNLQGKAAIVRSWFPFDCEITFGNRHCYAHDGFVKPEFRGNSILEMLYLKSFEILKSRFDYLDALVYDGNFGANKVALKAGFTKVKNIVFVKLFFLKLILVLDNGIKNKMYVLFTALFKLSLAIWNSIKAIRAILRNRMNRSRWAKIRIKI